MRTFPNTRWALAHPMTPFMPTERQAGVRSKTRPDAQGQIELL